MTKLAIFLIFFDTYSHYSSCLSPRSQQKSLVTKNFNGKFTEKLTNKLLKKFWLPWNGFQLFEYHKFRKFFDKIRIFCRFFKIFVIFLVFPASGTRQSPLKFINRALHSF